MDARTSKLAVKLGDLALAEKLVRAGLDTPRKIKAAKELRRHVTKAQADKVREKIRHSG